MIKKLNFMFLGLAFVTTVHAQILHGGLKNFGVFSHNKSQWFFTQILKSRPLDREYYDRGVKYRNRELKYDINNDGIKDAGDFAFKTNNSVNGYNTDYLLVTVPDDGSNGYEGSEIEIYTDCIECISFYNDGNYENINSMNLFYRFSKVVPTDGTEVRTITTIPFLLQIPANSQKRNFTVEIGYTMRFAKKVDCSNSETSDYQLFPTAGGDPSRPLKSSDSYYLKNDEYCNSFKVKEKIYTSRINWGNEIEVDRSMIVYKFSY